MFEVVTLLATIPAVLALVNLLKKFGVTGKWSILTAVILGIVLQLLDYGFLEQSHSPQGWYSAAAAGLVLGLSASGLYDVAETVGGAKSESLPIDIHVFQDSAEVKDGGQNPDDPRLNFSH